MSDEFPYVDVGIMEKDIGIFMYVFQSAQKVAFYIFIGVVAVDKGYIDLRKSEGLEGCKELVRPQFVMSYHVLHAELFKVLLHSERLAPFVLAADSLERAVF